MILEEFGQHIGSGYSYTLYVKKVLVVTPFQNASMHQTGIIDKAMNALRLFVEHPSGKIFQNLFFCNVTGIACYVQSFLVHAFCQGKSGFLVVVDKVNPVAL